MDSAKRSLETGQLDWAMLHLQAAESWLLVGGYETSAELHRLYGAYYQRKGDYNEADVHFAWALSIAETNLQRGMILLGWSLVALERREISRAKDRLAEGMSLLLPYSVRSEDQKARHDAYNVGLSIRGQIALARGNRESAMAYFLVVDCCLREGRGRPEDELDNLMQLIKVQRFSARRRTKRRALRLAWEIGHIPRIFQLDPWLR